MTFSQFMRIFWVWRWFIALSALSSAAAATWVAVTHGHTYTAQSHVLTDPLRPDELSGNTVPAALIDAYMSAQIELIRDERVTGRVVDHLGWAQLPAIRAAYSASDVHDLSLRSWLARQIGDNARIDNDEGSTIIAIGYTSRDPVEAATIANALREAFVAQTIATKQNDANRAKAFIDRQLADARGQLATAQQASVAYERSNDLVLLNDDKDLDTDRLITLTRSAPQPTVVPVPAATGGADAGGSAQLAALDAKIAAAAVSLGPNHPQLQAMRQERAALAAAVGKAVAPSSRPVVVASGPSIAEVRSRVLASRDKVDQARLLRGNVAILRDRYAKLAARAADLRQQAASDDSGITLLNDAVPPHKPDPPVAAFVIVVSLVLGLILGMLVALFVEFLHQRVRDVEDLQVLHVPVIGTIRPLPQPI